MNNNIKNFNEYKASVVDESLLGDVAGKILPMLGRGFGGAIKEKIASFILSKIGIKPNTILSKITQEFVDALFKDMDDVTGVISGDNLNVEFLAPRIAEAIQEYIQNNGMVSLVAPFGVDTNGWLYKIISEGLQGELGKENITKFILDAFEDNKISGNTISDLTKVIAKEK